MRGRASRPSFDNGDPHTGAGVPRRAANWRRTPTTSTTKQPKSTASAKQTKFPLSRPFGALRPSLEKCTSFHTNAGWAREEVAPPFGLPPGGLPTPSYRLPIDRNTYGLSYTVVTRRIRSLSSPPLQSRRGPEPRGVCVSRNFGKRRRPPDEKRAGTLVPAQRRRNDRLFSSPGISP